MNIVLFFTRSVTLKQWIAQGLFDREKLLYETFIKQSQSINIYWITYGRHDSIIASNLYNQNSLSRKIHVISKPPFFPEGKYFDLIYSLLIPFIYFSLLSRASLIKSNQLDGSWAGLLSSHIFRKPFILRLGFLPSQVEYAACSRNKIRFKLLCLIEKIMASASPNIITTTSSILNTIHLFSSLGKKNCAIIPNYVNTDLFSSSRELSFRDEKIVYYGRLSPEKNLFELIEACHLANIHLDIFGDGPLLNALNDYIKKHNYKVTLSPPLPNSELPCLLNKYRYFALVSSTEGMPKTLIESMSCGVIPIVSPIEPITNILGADYNFVSSSHSSDSISLAITKAMTCSSQLLSDNLSQLVKSRYSISSIAKQELDFYLTVLSRS